MPGYDCPPGTSHGKQQEHTQVTDQPLSHIERVDLRTIWTSEPGDFTPWLAEPDNLERLGEALQLELEPESVEAEVGSFRADIVCRDIRTGTTVLIENQLERTDHDHLGKLLTYAAGLRAVTVVWVAASFREEHRAALDWLNEVTHEDTRFFGLEIELWRIADSPVAPKFNPVSMPNDWSRSVAPAIRGAKRSETGLRRMEYWSGLQSVLDDHDGPVRGNRKPQQRNVMDYPLGRSHFHLVAWVNGRDKHIRAGLYIKGKGAKEHLAILERQSDEIESELGFPLEWGAESPTSQDSIAACYYRDVDPDDESDWPRQHKWLAQRLNDLHRVFAERVRDM